MTNSSCHLLKSDLLDFCHDQKIQFWTHIFHHQRGVTALPRKFPPIAQRLYEKIYKNIKRKWKYFILCFIFLLPSFQNPMIKKIHKASTIICCKRSSPSRFFFAFLLEFFGLFFSSLLFERIPESQFAVKMRVLPVELLLQLVAGLWKNNYKYL